MKTPASLRLQAFTLIEILTVMTIIFLLAALSYAGLSSMRDSAERADALSRMRQVGAAVQMFAGENDGTMPGPLWSGQNALYNTGDTRTLGYHLWSYMGAPEPKGSTQEAKLLVPRVFIRKRPKTGTNFLVVQQKLNNVNPWGYWPSGSANPTDAPKKLASLGEAAGTGTQTLMNTWAMQDIDKTNKNVDPGAGWVGDLVTQPIFKPYRLNLYFDWHVEAVAITK